MAQKTIVIWGAGKIGRGFVADVFHAAEYHVVFVDASSTLVAQLREAGCYTVVRAESSERRQDALIAGYRALSTAQTDEVAAAIAETDLLALAVFPQDFAQVAQQITRGMLYRQARYPHLPLDIILCTNLAHAGPQFRALLQETLPIEAREYLDSQVGMVET